MQKYEVYIHTSLKQRFEGVCGLYDLTQNYTKYEVHTHTHTDLYIVHACGLYDLTLDFLGLKWLSRHWMGYP